MEFGVFDYCAFIGYIAIVVGFAMYVSRREESSEDYFLAGRKLTWWLIGISLIASNISTEHFVGMAGAGYATGLAIASYEWMAAVAIVLVAIFLLPKFLRSGIYTIPEFLEYRYSFGARGLMACYMMAAYVFVIIAAVLYAGAVGLEQVFELDLVYGVWLIGIIAGVYTVWGGLKAVVWADLFNGLGLILGGVVVTFLGFHAMGGDHGIAHGITTFFQNAGDKLQALKPWNHPEVPWVAVFIGGMWIPQLFYWGLNQFITQRALAAKSVAEGQRGMLFAACLKLLMPFIIVFPGIMAFELFGEAISNQDKAYPHMIQAILPAGLRGLMFAALFGAVMSSLDSMLNSASTIFTMDLYKRHVNQQASERSLITLGRVMTALFVVTACFWAPQLGWIAGGKGVFDYIQKTWGFITPGVFTVFFFGLFSKRTPAPAAVGAMLLGPSVYAWCLWAMPRVAFLHHMAFTFIALAAYLLVLTIVMPLRDVEASAEPVAPDGQTGFLRRHLVPYVTAIIGAFLISRPVFQFSYTTLLYAPEWVHWVIAGSVVAIYFVAALCVVRLPAPAVRAVAAREAKAPAATNFWRLLRLATVALAGGAVLGLHVVLFCSWAMPETMELADGSITTLVGTAKQYTIAAVVVGLFLAIFTLVVRKPVMGETQLPVTTMIDLTPAAFAKTWGVIILAAAAVLYIVF